MTENEPKITVIEPEYYEEAELLAIMETTGKGPAYYLQHYSPEVHSDYSIYCELNNHGHRRRCSRHRFYGDKRRAVCRLHH